MGDVDGDDDITDVFILIRRCMVCPRVAGQARVASAGVATWHCSSLSSVFAHKVPWPQKAGCPIRSKHLMVLNCAGYDPDVLDSNSMSALHHLVNKANILQLRNAGPDKRQLLLLFHKLLHRGPPPPPTGRTALQMLANVFCAIPIAQTT